MREKGPEFTVVGNIPEEDKENERTRLKEAIGEKHLFDLPEESKKELLASEYPKTKAEKKLIALANENINKIMQKVGVASFDVPENNIHIVPFGLLEKIVGKQAEKGGLTLLKEQAIFFDVKELRENLLEEASSFFFHELWHLKNHLTLEIQDKARFHEEEGVESIKLEREKSIFRGGITVHAAQKKREAREYHEHFRGLNEAVAVYFEQKFIEELLRHPLFSKERKWLESDEAKKLRQVKAFENKISEEDISWVGPSGEEWWSYQYPRHLKIFKYLLGEIVDAKFNQAFSEGEKAQGKHNAKTLLELKKKITEDVALEFARAAFTGKLSPITHLVNETFGPLGFRILGQMGHDKESPVSILELLKKARLEQLKEQKNHI